MMRLTEGTESCFEVCTEQAEEGWREEQTEDHQEGEQRNRRMQEEEILG